MSPAAAGSRSFAAIPADPLRVPKLLGLRPVKLAIWANCPVSIPGPAKYLAIYHISGQTEFPGGLALITNHSKDRHLGSDLDSTAIGPLVRTPGIFRWKGPKAARPCSPGFGRRPFLLHNQTASKSPEVMWRKHK